LYRLGLALFELENPEKCLLRGDSWIFGPEADYERHGDVDDVVFPCGYTMDSDGDALNIYHGAATARLPWPGAAFATCSIGWLTMEASANAGESRTDESAQFGNPFCLWVSSSSHEWCFHDQERTYMVCFDCGEEFDLPVARMPQGPRTAENARRHA
jgi:hypothetical protein